MYVLGRVCYTLTVAVQYTRLTMFRLYHYTPYSTRMSQETTHKLMGFYMKGLILGIGTVYMLFCFFKLFRIGYIGI